MEITVARHCGEGVVEHIRFSDPYQAYNFINTYCGKVSAVVKCEELYSIGTGENKEENCYNCPLEGLCLCPNRVYCSPKESCKKVVNMDFTKK